MESNMRKDEEFQAEMNQKPPSNFTMIEVLLDIRELLTKLIEK